MRDGFSVAHVVIRSLLGPLSTHSGQYSMTVMGRITVSAIPKYNHPIDLSCLHKD